MYSLVSANEARLMPLGDLSEATFHKVCTSVMDSLASKAGLTVMENLVHEFGCCGSQSLLLSGGAIVMSDVSLCVCGLLKTL